MSGKCLLKYREWELTRIDHEDLYRDSTEFLYSIKIDGEFYGNSIRIDRIKYLIDKYKDDPFAYFYFPGFLLKIKETFPEEFI